MPVGWTECGFALWGCLFSGRAALVTVRGAPQAARYCGANAVMKSLASFVEYENPTPRVNSYEAPPESGTSRPRAIALSTFVCVR